MSCLFHAPSVTVTNQATTTTLAPELEAKLTALPNFNDESLQRLFETTDVAYRPQVYYSFQYFLLQQLGFEQGIQAFLTNFPSHMPQDVIARDQGWLFALGGQKIVPLLKKLYLASKVSNEAKIIILKTLPHLLTPTDLINFLNQEIKGQPSGTFLTTWFNVMATAVTTKEEVTAIIQNLTALPEKKRYNYQRIFLEEIVRQEKDFDFQLLTDSKINPLNWDFGRTYLTYTQDPAGKAYFLAEANFQQARTLMTLLKRQWLTDCVWQPTPQDFLNLFNFFAQNDNQDYQAAIDYLNQPEQEALRLQIEDLLFDRQTEERRVFNQRPVFDFLTQSPQPTITLAKVENCLKQSFHLIIPSAASSAARHLLGLVQINLLARTGQDDLARQKGKDFFTQTEYYYPVLLKEPPAQNLPQLAEKINNSTYYLTKTPVLQELIQEEISSPAVMTKFTANNWRKLCHLAIKTGNPIFFVPQPGIDEGLAMDYLSPINLQQAANQPELLQKVVAPVKVGLLLQVHDFARSGSHNSYIENFLLQCLVLEEQGKLPPPLKSSIQSLLPTLAQMPKINSFYAEILLTFGGTGYLPLIGQQVKKTAQTYQKNNFEFSLFDYESLLLLAKFKQPRPSK